MYVTIGKIATSVVAIIITDVLMEKYDVRGQIKKRYTETCTAATRLASKVRSNARQDESATAQTEAQEAPDLTRRQRFDVWSADLEHKFYVWEAGTQLRLARRAERLADTGVSHALAHLFYCKEVAAEYKRNYIHLVPISDWAGSEDEKEYANV